VTPAAVQLTVAAALWLAAAEGAGGPARPPESRTRAPGAMAEQPLLTHQPLTPALQKLVKQAHGHPAVGSLEAAGCDLALVMTRAAYNRFVALRYGKKMPAQTDDSVGQVVWCQSRSTTPPDCAAVAPIVARVARLKQSFQVFSGSIDPPFSPRCAGVHDAKGKFVSGEGPGYPSSRK
jgi:hypothetical protein